MLEKKVYHNCERPEIPADAGTGKYRFTCPECKSVWTTVKAYTHEPATWNPEHLTFRWEKQ